MLKVFSKINLMLLILCLSILVFPASSFAATLNANNYQTFSGTITTNPTTGVTFPFNWSSNGPKDEAQIGLWTWAESCGIITGDVTVTVTYINNKPGPDFQEQLYDLNTSATFPGSATSTDVNDAFMSGFALINSFNDSGATKTITFSTNLVSQDITKIAYVQATGNADPLAPADITISSIVLDTGSAKIDTSECKNTAPVAVDENTTTDMGVDVTYNVLDNDYDIDGDALSVSGTPVINCPVSFPNCGTISVAAGDITFSPASDFFGTVTIDYLVSDGQTTDAGVLTIVVNEVYTALYCPEPYDTNQILSDEGDCDEDGISNLVENYLDDVDTDNDGIFDWLDLDTDNDGIPDEIELTADPDGDGKGNWRDIDSDGDSKLDIVEAGHGSADANGDGMVDGDVDTFGVPLALPDSYNLKDSDNNGVPDFLQVDNTMKGTLPRTGSVITTEFYISIISIILGIFAIRRSRKIFRN